MRLGFPGLILGCCLLAILLYRREGFSELAPATYLGWDGVRWEICDNRNRTRGIESIPGGTVIVCDVSAVQVVGQQYILAKNGAGQMFLIKVDEWGADDVQTFSAQGEWLSAVKEIGVTSPDLKDPAKFYK